MILRLIQLGLVDPFQNEDMPASSDYDRLRLHPLVMRFARELFMAGRVQNGGYPADSQNTAYTRMARYYIDYIRRLTPRDENDRDSKLYKALDPDEASIEAVLAGSRGRIDDESVVQLVEALWPYWDARFRVQTALTYMPFGIQAARRLASARPTETRQLRLAQLELAYAKMLLRADRWQEVNDELNRNLVIRRNLNDRRGEGIVRSRMAELALSQATEGCLEIAEGHLQKSISIHRQVGNLQGEIIDLQRMAEVSRRSADLHQARKWLEQALDVYKTPRPLQGKGVVLAELGRIAETVGNSDQAIDYYKAGLELLREAGDIVNIAGVALSLGESLVCNKKQREGCALIREAILLRRTRSLPNLAEAEEIANRLNCPLLQS